VGEVFKVETWRNTETIATGIDAVVSP